MMADAIPAQNPRIRKPRAPLTLERLREVLFYDPDTGAFGWTRHAFWRVRGKPAGYIYPPTKKQKSSYLAIKIDHRRYYAQNLAWFYVYGYLPKQLVDHRDLDGLNNRISNLRECSIYQNRANTGLTSRNKSGFKGVRLVKGGKWLAIITHAKKQIHLGRYPSPQAASAAYARKASELFGEFARTE